MRQNAKYFLSLRDSTARKTLQTKDDSVAESAQTFTLELTSASGGATINAAAKTARILVVATDYPHGLFEFEHPSQVTVQEEAAQVLTPGYCTKIAPWSSR